MFVKRPNYVLLAPTGELQEIFCKACGTAIGGVKEAVKGRRMTRSGQWVEERVASFRRFHNYAELKMAFADGSFHVTNGCNKCLNESLSARQLQALHDADMDVEGTPSAKDMKKRTAVRSVAIRTDGGGIA